MNNDERWNADGYGTIVIGKNGEKSMTVKSRDGVEHVPITDDEYRDRMERIKKARGF